MTIHSESEIAALLQRDLPHWTYADGFIRRTYRTYGWKGTLMVINTIGHLAEAAWHHPEISAGYASVEVRLQSHDAGGITARDFALATKIEEVVAWRPNLSGGPLEGTPVSNEHGYISYD